MACPHAALHIFLALALMADGRLALDLSLERSSIKRRGESMLQRMRSASIVRAVAIYLATIVLATAGSTRAPAQVDRWQQKLNEYVNTKHHMILVTKRPEIVVVYLCQPGGRGWWAYKLTNETLRRANFKLRGMAVYNTYPVGGQSHGQGVFFGHEKGPLTERAPVANEQFKPIGGAAMSLEVMSDAGLQELDLGAIPAKVVAEIASKCLGRSFPRVLHRCVPVGHAAPCRPAGTPKGASTAPKTGGPWGSVNPSKNCATICIFGNCPPC